MTMMGDLAEAPWILVTVNDDFSFLQPWKDMERRYRVVQWTEFMEKGDDYAGKIEGVLLGSPAFCQGELTEVHLKKMSRVKVFSTVGTGFNHLDLPLLRKYGIRAGNTPDLSTDVTGTFAFTLLLTAARRIPENMAAARGYSPGCPHDCSRYLKVMGRDVTGKTLAILGMGNIGFTVAKRATGFNMRTIYHNRRQRSVDEEEQVNATYCSNLEDMLKEADFLMLTAPMTPETRHIMNRERLRLMKPSSIIINVARGGLIDHDHLVEALKNGTIGGAALDATDPEPLPDDHPLLHMSNVIVTPHVSVFTPGVLEKYFRIALENLAAGIEGREIPYAIEM